MSRHLKPTLHLLAWGFVALALVYAAVGPHGALYDNPLGSVGVGLIGLGALVEAYRRGIGGPTQASSCAMRANSSRRA